MVEDLDMQCDMEPVLSMEPECMDHTERKEIAIVDHEIDKLIEIFKEHMSCKKEIEEIKCHFYEQKKADEEVIESLEVKADIYKEIVRGLFEKKGETLEDDSFEQLEKLAAKEDKLKVNLKMMQEKLKEVENEVDCTTKHADNIGTLTRRVYQRLNGILLEKDSSQECLSSSELGEKEKEAESESLAKELEKCNEVMRKMQEEMSVLNEMLKNKENLSPKPEEMEADAEPAEKQLKEAVEKQENEEQKDKE